MKSIVTSSTASKSGTQVVQRVAALLHAISACNRVGGRLIDLCDEVGIERPTAHRILQGLVSEGLVRQDESTKRYFLGNAIYEMGLAASPRTNLRDLCHPYLQQIAQQTGDTVFLIMRSGFDGVCIDRVEGAFPIKVFLLDVGRRRPLNIGGGAQAILSFLGDDDINRILRVNLERSLEKHPNYLESNVRKTIARARAKGYVVTDALDLPGVRSLGMPVFDRLHRPVAGISVSSVLQRMDRNRTEMITSCMAKAIEQIQAHLAQVDPDSL